VSGVTLRPVSAQNQAVTRAIRHLVRPRLEAAGFQDFTGRKAWRREGDRVDVVDFQAVGAYSSVGVGCTPFSFGVFTGVRYAECEERWSGSSAHEHRPHYSACTVTVILGKLLRQPGAFRPWGPAYEVEVKSGVEVVRAGWGDSAGVPVELILVGVVRCCGRCPVPVSGPT
jgi:hypothetical protein